MFYGCCVTVSNPLGKKTHTSQSLIEECLTGSSNRKDSFVEMTGKKMKNGLNGFSDFYELITHLFSYKQK